MQSSVFLYRSIALLKLYILSFSYNSIRSKVHPLSHENERQIWISWTFHFSKIQILHNFYRNYIILHIIQ